MNGRAIRWSLVGSWLAACSPVPDTVPGQTEGTESSSTSEGDLDTGVSSTTTEGLDESSGSDGSTGELPPDPGDPYDPPPPLDPLPDDRLAALQAAIDGHLANPAVSFADQGVLIIDAATEQVLYERNPDVLRTPASNTKLFTTAAAMGALGEDHSVGVEVWSETAIDAMGVVSGELHLVGHHDFSWSDDVVPGPARLSLDLVAERLYDAGLREVTDGLTAQGEFLYDGYSLGTYNATTHRNLAAARFREALVAAGITVGPSTNSSSSFAPPPGAVMLERWDAPPLSVGAVPLNVYSHNEFADILLRHLGWALAGTSDYATGATELSVWMDDMGLAGDEVMFFDGSGLSHNNAVTPRHVIDLLQVMATVPEGVAWRRTFSIAGVRGTLGGRMLGADTWGRVHGKTGTLTGVIATSGVVYNRWDHREYLFAILMNGTGDAGSTRAIHDAVIGEVAADIRGEPTPPPTPVLRSVRHEPGTTIAHVQWDPVAGADGYLVWLSPDGLVWDRADARYVTTTEHRAGTLPFPEPPLFVRVSAVGPEGESEPSDVYATWVGDRPARVLVVDGNDRWQDEPVPENPMGVGHDFAAVHGRALAEASAGTLVGFDTAANETIVDGLVALDDYDLVVWALGEEGIDHDTFSAAEQGLVTAYLDDEGSLMVSGSEIGWDLVEQGNAADQAFYSDVLHAQYLGDQADTYFVRGEGELVDEGQWRFFTPGAMNVQFADRLVPTPDAEQAAGYVRGLGDGAAALYLGPGSVLHLAFPFESVDEAIKRVTLMERALDLLL
ncbi:D-alanyl-D-alanine carboxypeptidase/D-alanyl-D-alanine-endopeptidase [Paraliomyxa miuraensis]|uniref:D-alanyl-D-alanine carboxypeptidase/D-alanyl-D-alanine-endopeptidase n=1 Tax=Paraliomyxa miuraensis TaxID=376150 RepID=UPI00224DF3BB|nr:D-alanyl-D-alanine carboxypeptidase [Paraliomyxa miuraensis]MCX4246038.1 D-alanyl-D-alanine carboxypeptidase [Paraliomyxa miuraensis]